MDSIRCEKFNKNLDFNPYIINVKRNLKGKPMIISFHSVDKNDIDTEAFYYDISKIRKRKFSEASWIVNTKSGSRSGLQSTMEITKPHTFHKFDFYPVGNDDFDEIYKCGEYRVSQTKPIVRDWDEFYDDKDEDSPEYKQKEVVGDIYYAQDREDPTLRCCEIRDFKDGVAFTSKDLAVFGEENFMKCEYIKSSRKNFICLSSIDYEGNLTRLMSILHHKYRISDLLKFSGIIMMKLNKNQFLFSMNNYVSTNESSKVLSIALASLRIFIR